MAPRQQGRIENQDFRERILGELKRLGEEIQEVGGKIDNLKDKEISSMKVEIGMLRVKAGVWGLLGGLIPVAIAILIALVRGPK